MNELGRKRKRRVVDVDHSKVCFKPCGVRRIELEQIIVYEDEMEAIRLADFESLYQEESAKKMGISRTTFSRLIESARKKIADALLNQKAINISPRNTIQV